MFDRAHQLLKISGLKSKQKAILNLWEFIGAETFYADFQSAHWYNARNFPFDISFDGRYNDGC